MRGKVVLKMRKTIKWSLTAGLLLPLCGIAYPVPADDGQLSSWEDSNFIDYPPPPVGGWEPLMPTYDPEKENGPVNAGKQTTNTATPPAAAQPPAQYAPQAGTAYATPPAPTYTAPAVPAYAPWPPAPTYTAPAAPAYAPRPPAAAPGYNRGFVRPSYIPGYNRPAYPAGGFARPGFNRGFNAPGATVIPGNHGNPWNDGHPGGWSATPWGELGPAGWTYPVQNAATDTVTSTPDPQNSLNTMSGGFNAAATNAKSAAETDNAHKNVSAPPVPGFNWSLHN